MKPRQAGAPPTTLASGKTNPEYSRWYIQTPVGRQKLEAYRQRQDVKDRKRKYSEMPEVKAKAAARSREEWPTGKIVCIDCKSSYHKIHVVERGWRRVGPFGCLCEVCQ